MGLIALLIALLIEQFRPRTGSDRLRRMATTLADTVRARLGETVGWIVLVGAVLVAVWLLDGRLQREYPLIVFVAHVAILYFTIGFRRLGQAFASIRAALMAEESGRARREFDRWLTGVDLVAGVGAAGSTAHADADADAGPPEGRETDRDAGGARGDTARAHDVPGVGHDHAESESELCRAAGAAALVAMHRHLFAPLFWYLLLPGIAGPLLYRVYAFLAQRWSDRHPHAALPEQSATSAPSRQEPVLLAGLPSESSDGAQAKVEAEDTRLREVLRAAWRALRDHGPLAAVRTIRSAEPGLLARRLFYWLDWPALRFSAAGFAIMGNFEDALYCWRTAIATGTGHDARALLLAAGSGALGVRLAEAALAARWASGEQGGDCAVTAPDTRTLRAVVSLVWRAAALWVGLLALLTIAGWLGR